MASWSPKRRVRRFALPHALRHTHDARPHFLMLSANCSLALVSRPLLSWTLIEGDSRQPTCQARLKPTSARLAEIRRPLYASDDSPDWLARALRAKVRTDILVHTETHRKIQEVSYVALGL